MIYLASQSKARMALLKRLGLRFKVIPSRVKENRRAGSLSYAQLVKRNALRKAREVSSRVSSGIIIAADTIVVQDGRIFGKPKDLKDAKKMLRRLSSKPQQLYTGIAVIDRDKNKTLVDCEKTKVYMDQLTDKEIDRYFIQVSPLDKAGSFDIQGKGALFIRRIEGCFYNVVGLPLRKLYRILRSLGVLLFLLFFLSGCASEYNIATGQEEAFYYSSDREEALGKAIARKVEKEYKLVEDPLIQKRVEDIGKKIVEVSDRKDITYTFKALDEEDLNAFSLPGGFVYVNKGLIDKVASDDELAAVLSHEISHIVARHSIKKLQALQGYSILRILVAQAPESAKVGTAADAAFAEILTGYAREDELLADQLGVRYTRLAGYDSSAMIAFLEKLQEVNRRKPPERKSYFKTHPYVPDRIRVVKQELGKKLEFTDYINIEQKPHDE